MKAAAGTSSQEKGASLRANNTLMTSTALQGSSSYELNTFAMETGGMRKGNSLGMDPVGITNNEKSYAIDSDEQSEKSVKAANNMTQS